MDLKDELDRIFNYIDTIKKAANSNDFNSLEKLQDFNKLMKRETKKFDNQINNIHKKIDNEKGYIRQEKKRKKIFDDDDIIDPGTLSKEELFELKYPKN